jgi:hypothetical protein
LCRHLCATLLLRNGQQFCCLQATGSVQLSCAGSKEERQVIDPSTYVSFLVRLWCETNPERTAPVTGWQGEVEHIQTGRRWTFSTLGELLAFLRRQVEDPKVLRWPTDE